MAEIDTRFLTGGAAWQRCRAGAADPRQFGLGDVSPQIGGWDYLLRLTLLDAAALNKQEMLCWDGWGIGERLGNPDAEAAALVDEIATLTLAPDTTPLHVRMTSDAHVGIGDSFLSGSPVAGLHRVDAGALRRDR